MQHRFRGALWWVVAGLLGSCGHPAPPPTEDHLTPEARLVRISMALRGIRPSLAELDRVTADGSAVPDLVDQWLHDPDFGETIKDLWAESLTIRADTEPILLSRGPLENTSTDRIFEAMSESPLRLIEDVVTNDRPFTDVVTADYLMANPVLHDLYGVPYDPTGAEWQRSTWPDDRPSAGILSDDAMWMRIPSNGNNFHRGRANFVSKVFLCDEIGDRDVTVGGGVDLSDLDAVANAVQTNPSCLGCHSALEPLAAFFWGFRQDNLRTGTQTAYDTLFCVGEAADYCYPLNFWKWELTDGWQEHGLPSPSYYGRPGADLADLGQYIAQDPRFAECVTRRFYGYLTQQDPLDLPVSTIQPLEDAFVASGYDARTLTRDIVLSPQFDRIHGPTDQVVPLQVVRPEQYDRTVADLTGFRLRGSFPCNFDGCFDDLDLANSDRYGFRSMSGGIDGLAVTRPSHTITPTKLMFSRYFAAEAAGYVVSHEPERLFTGSLDDTDDASVRAQMALLHRRILGVMLGSDDPEIDRTKALWDGVLSRGGTPEGAWSVVVAALLQDPGTLFY